MPAWMRVRCGSYAHRAWVGAPWHPPWKSVTITWITRPRMRFVRRSMVARCNPRIPAYRNYDAYVKGGGYALLRQCRVGQYSFDQLVTVLTESGLRGLGGAGFPAARKWQFVRAESGPRYFCLNADEGEPGTFKDRHYLESDPHRVLEGMLIACWAMEAVYGVIYLRDEYPAAREIPRPRDRRAGRGRGHRRRRHSCAPRSRRVHLR